jgi:hypothetical protein
LYSADRFAEIELPRAVRQALLHPA